MSRPAAPFAWYYRPLQGLLLALGLYLLARRGIVRDGLMLLFLEALFLIFVALALGVGRLLGSVAGCVLILLCVASADLAGLTDVRLLSLGQAIGLLPYFVAGTLAFSLSRNRPIARQERMFAAAALLLAAGLRLGQMNGADLPWPGLSLAALVSLFVLMPAVPLLAAIGKRSMSFSTMALPQMMIGMLTTRPKMTRPSW